MLDPALVLSTRARRSRLDRSATCAEEATDAVVALHGTDPASVHLSVWARRPPAPITDVAGGVRAALEEDRSILRVMAMRRTVHLLRRPLAAAAASLASARLGGPARKQAKELIVAAGLSEADWPRLRERVLEALGDLDLDADALHEQVPDLGRRVSLAEGKTYAGSAPISRYVLHALSVEGVVVRARSRGGWRNNRTTWARTDRWCPDLVLPSPADAYRALAEAWIDAFGPATLDDLAWWAGIPKKDAAAAVAALGAEVVEVEVRGWPGKRLVTRRWLDDLAPADHPPAFLPALDPLLMATKERGAVMDPAWAALLFDRSGNGGPTIWAGGRVVGGWAVRADGSVATRILAAGVDEAAVAEGARALAEALGGEVVQPRFPTPLVKDLAR